ncbi:MAG: TPR end-of-group domain-containing protein [Gammaproteobacteria bacterium]
MALWDSFTKSSKLDTYKRQTAQARKNEGAKADHLFKSACEGFAQIIRDDPIRAQALYFWGNALLHQAKTKSGEEAIRVYKEAILRFSCCMLIDPNYLAAAIDGGVAYMDMARLEGAQPNAELYEQARIEFEKANSIQAGSASYNLACIYALRGDGEACLKALETARDNGSLPVADDILSDPDLDGVKNKDWFIAFMESLAEKKEEAVETAAKESEAEQSE